MSHAITLIYGDGIGPEVVLATKEIVEAAQVKVSWDEQLLGLSALKKYDQALPQSTIDSIKANKVALKGPTTTPIGHGHQSANVALRKALDLYACVRPVKSIPGLESRFSDVDLVIIRENTEGLYSGHEVEVSPGCVISLRIMTEKGCSRIAKAAFVYAKSHGRPKVCAVHKANILKLGDGLWLACADKLRQNFPDIVYETGIVDSVCMKLVMNPASFDVLFLENMFGDIVSDLCAGLIGGLGLAPGANIGDEHAVFEAVHGSAPDIAGQDLANPTATIMSAVMMLRHIGEQAAAGKIERALMAVLAEKPLRTKDLSGDASTKRFAESVMKRL